jgi:TatD DNase family protein
MIDTHCHLTHPRFDADRVEVIERAASRGVARCVTIGTGVDDGRRALGLAGEFPGRLFATAGLDPFSAHAAGDRFDEAMDQLAELLRGGGFVAVGEIGLDYHYDLDPRPLQRRRFEGQLVLAVELDLPVVIHVREAHPDMGAVLADHPRARGVIHSFTAGPGEAERYLELGWHLAFNGVLTFRNATEVREAARQTPLDRLLIETDSPYLAPAPHRGKRCEPAFAQHTLDALAKERRDAITALDRITTANAVALFGLE